MGIQERVLSKGRVESGETGWAEVFQIPYTPEPLSLLNFESSKTTENLHWNFHFIHPMSIAKTQGAPHLV